MKKIVALMVIVLVIGLLFKDVLFTERSEVTICERTVTYMGPAGGEEPHGLSMQK